MERNTLTLLLGGVSLRQLWGLLAAGCLVLSCVSGPPSVPHGAIALRADVSIQALVPGVWRHVPYKNVHGWGPLGRSEACLT